MEDGHRIRFGSQGKACIPSATQLNFFLQKKIISHNCQVPQNAGIYLTTKNPPTVQVELISEYLDSLRPNTNIFQLQEISESCCSQLINFTNRQRRPRVSGDEIAIIGGCSGHHL